MTLDELTKVARVAHEANRAYCATLGDHSQVEWDQSPTWLCVSVIKGVRFVLEHPDATPRDSHASWLAEKVADGWVYGEAKDPEKKTHPRLVPYDSLPVEQRRKDALFLGVVRALLVGAA